jgi:hypothetical protein
MRAGVCRRAHCRIADRDAYTDAGASNGHLDSDTNAICNSEPNHCADVGADGDAIANANADGHTFTRAGASPSPASQLCAVASLARL